MRPRLTDMLDPMLMRDMDEAVAIIIDAVENRERITIYGDYDADGLTATALLLNFFSDLGYPVSYYIPNRLEDGYGLNFKSIADIARKGKGLIITVDCGISNKNEISVAKKSGLNVVVTDHHQLPEEFHSDCPVVNPHRPDCPFPFKDLSGVGVAFFLAVAVRSSLREKGWFKRSAEPDLKEYLDLVALGTVADRVSLLGQNRILVKSGIEIMANSRWAGLNAMKVIAGIEGEETTAEDLAFRLAPRLNAPGRIGSCEKGLELLTIEDDSVARELAIKINTDNNLRKEMEQEICRHIDEMIKANGGVDDFRTIIMAGKDWHKGVLGIVASRLVDRYNRPSLVLNISDDIAVGSGRSIKGFNLFDALNKNRNLLERFGGHSSAAGLLLKSKNLEALKIGLEELAEQTLNKRDTVPSITIDADLALEEINHETLKQIGTLAPFGEGNPEPCFLGRSLEVMDARIVGERHLKLVVRQGTSTFDAIGFRLAGRLPPLGSIISVVFTPEINRWQGNQRIQLRIIDLKKGDGIYNAISL